MRHNTGPTREDELELLSGLLADDDIAWRQFHVTYDHLIFRCIRKVTGSFSSVIRSDDEREIYANLILQLLSHGKRKLRSFDPDRGSRLGTWLGLLATNAAYDCLRSLRRELPRAPLSEADAAKSPADSPYDEVERKQRSRVMDRLMTRLSAKDQQFVRLYFKRELTPEAVADAMSISVKTVYSKKHKIQGRLGDIVATMAA